MVEIATTNIRIEREKLSELKRRALEQNRSLASLLRELIDDYLGFGAAESGDILATAQRQAIELWKGASLGTGFAGRDHDDVLYGDDP